ncbi:MAG: hypothetical protein JSW10_02230, partial [Pseudomonadota bacterium]
AAVLLVAAWVFFAVYEAPSRFDLTPKLTLPLMLAVEATAVFAIYAVWRYNSRKGGTAASVRELVARMYSEGERTDEHKDEHK